MAGAKRLTQQPRLPCAMHGWPELWPENVLAWKLWQMASYQVMVFPGATPAQNHVELKYESVIPLIQLYCTDPQQQQETLEKIVLCQQVALSSGVFDFLKHDTSRDAVVGAW